MVAGRIPAWSLGRDHDGTIVGALTNLALYLALDDPGITRRIAELGDAPLALKPAAFNTLVADETEKWAQVIRVAGVKAE